MPKESIILNGIMNLDDNNNVIPKVHHKYARNVRFRGNPGNMRVENIKGTRAILNTLPAGTNQCVGAIYDELKQRVFWFNYNSNGRNGIYQYNTQTGVVTTLLLSFTNSPADILFFDPNHPIASVNILYTTEEDGDVLHWVQRNVRPKKLNIKDAIANVYGALWKAEYLTVARPMPLIAPICSYRDDSTLLLNNFRKKIFQFRYRWVYKDFTTSAYSPYSKIFTPFNPDDLATDLDQTKNNKIEVTVTTGSADVVKIEIAARVFNEGGVFSDDMQFDTLDKSALIIGNNTNYLYTFYNDTVPQTIKLSDSILLYDYVPTKANTQEFLNKNVLLYGGITEGLTFSETLNVTASVVAATTTGGNPLIVTVLNRGRGIAFVFSGAPLVGDEITLRVAGTGTDTEVSSFMEIYTVAAGNTTTDIRNYFNTAFAANIELSISNTTNTAPNPGVQIYQDGFFLTGGSGIIYATLPVTTDVGIASYRPLSKYPFGIVYFDEYGVTNGVVTNAAMKVTTNDIDKTGDAQPSISAIQFTVISRPPIWATTFSFVRGANATASNSRFLVTADTGKDAADFAYFDITNLQTNKDSISTYDFIAGDRVRVMGKFGTVFSTVKDYPLISLLTAPTINGVAKTGSWIKVPYDGSIMTTFGTAGFEHYFIEIYSPYINTTETATVYYEFGENYKVLNPGTATRYHAGQLQSQTATLPAIYSFARGDYYVRNRIMPNVANLSTTSTVWMFDRSISDKYPSKTGGTGRPFVIDPYAKEIYKPTLVRYSLAYQQGTNINQTNRFYEANFDEYDRQRGDIQRFKVRGTMLKVFQSRGNGQVPVYQQVISNADGTSNLIQSDKILNNIQYYQGEFGMGDQYCSLASSAGADYFSDPVRGYQCRLAGDGVSPISQLYKAQFYLPPILNKYLHNYTRTGGGKAKVLGVYDFFEEEFISIFQGDIAGNITSEALGFNETRNGYTSFYDIYPEWIICAENTLVSWKDGALLLHDSGTYNRYAGVDYPSKIDVVVNSGNSKKEFLTTGYNSGSVWTSPNIFTATAQRSNLIAGDYDVREGKYEAAFLRDLNSIGGLADGSYLVGVYIEIRYQKSSQAYQYLFNPFINYSTQLK